MFVRDRYNIAQINQNMCCLAVFRIMYVCVGVVVVVVVVVCVSCYKTKTKTNNTKQHALHKHATVHYTNLTLPTKRKM